MTDPTPDPHARLDATDPTPAEDARAALEYSEEAFDIWAYPDGDDICEGAEVPNFPAMYARAKESAARAARLARAYEHLQRNLTLLSQAIHHRSTQAIRDRFKGNTPEVINGETDELTVLFAEFEEQAREVERLRKLVLEEPQPVAVVETDESLRADLARVTQERDALLPLVKRIEFLRAESGCLDGACPHTKANDCLAALQGYAEEWEDEAVAALRAAENKETT